MSSKPSVRPPAVAGLFYPAAPGELEAAVRAHLEVGSGIAAGMSNPKAVIAPHAGYDYSGPVAGSAFASLAPSLETENDGPRRVVLIGPAHREPLRGLALPGTEALATPLGEIPVAAELVERVAGMPQVSVSPTAHALEHSLEVELPFLQLVLGEFSVLPLVVGEASAGEVAEVLEAVWGAADTTLVVSSDFSHYLSYEDARLADRSAAERVLSLDGTLAPRDACGAYSINGLLVAAERHGLSAALFDLRNSGDTGGDKSRVVGYGAFGFFES